MVFCLYNPQLLIYCQFRRKQGSQKPVQSYSGPFPGSSSAPPIRITFIRSSFPGQFRLPKCLSCTDAHGKSCFPPSSCRPDIIIPGFFKITFLLGGYQPAHIKQPPVQDSIIIRIPLLSFHIQDDLRTAFLYCFSSFFERIF